MRDAVWLLAALGLAYGIALIARAMRARLSRRSGRIVVWVLSLAVLPCPLLIPAGDVRLRSLSAFLSLDVAFKIVDSLRHEGMAFAEYALFLTPLPALGVVYPDHKRRAAGRRNSWPDYLRVALGTAGGAAAALGLIGLTRLGAVQSSFGLNHVVAVCSFVVAVESLSRAAWGVERLAGFDVPPIIRHAYLSRTVAEFWRRYNGRVYRWLELHVFRASGGRRAPARGVLLVFVVSGVLHEVMFAAATSEWTGYQLAFFTVQGPAVLASGRLERMARQGGLVGKVTAHVATIVFMATTSVLFFDGVNRVFPFVYSAPSPLR